MDNKIIALLIVAVLLIVGAGAALMGNANQNNETSDATGRLVVYGNANNDDYLNQNDRKMIEAIVNGESWDKKTNPFADTNADGVVDQADLTLFDKIMKKEECKMYYYNYYGNASYVHFPLKGDIGATLDYGLMEAQAIGIYDRVTAGTERVLGYSTDRYPGCTDFKSLGTNATVESIAETGVSVVMGRIDVKLHDAVRDADMDVDVILLHGTGLSKGKATPVSSILTLGTLFSVEKEAQKFASYYDKMNDMIADKTSQIKGENTYVMAYNPSSYTETKVDTTGADGSIFGDVYTVSHLPMTDISEPIGNGFYTVTMEKIISQNPEYIIISMWGIIDDQTTPEEAQAHFQDRCKYFEQTEAYKNGKIFGVCYETVGTFLGISAMPLLGSYIWPDVFDEDEGWKFLQEGYDNFTLLDKDVKQAGGLQVFKMKS